ALHRAQLLERARAVDERRLRHRARERGRHGVLGVRLDEDREPPRRTAEVRDDPGDGVLALLPSADVDLAHAPAYARDLEGRREDDRLAVDGHHERDQALAPAEVAAG